MSNRKALGSGEPARSTAGPARDPGPGHVPTGEVLSVLKLGRQGVVVGGVLLRGKGPPRWPTRDTRPKTLLSRVKMWPFS